jgi:hypothetical protein
MRILGQEIKGPNEELIVIPRGDSQIVLKARAVLDYKDFEKMCPEPTAPWIMKPGGAKERDYKDAKYVAAIRQRVTKQTYYMFIKSLEATPGLEWETIDIKAPETWLNFEKELESAGFSAIERNIITRSVFVANNLDEQKIEEARQRFIRSQETQVSNGTSQEDELTTTQSGGPANESE